jgi:hypothetical protein
MRKIAIGRFCVLACSTIVFALMGCGAAPDATEAAPNLGEPASTAAGGQEATGESKAELNSCPGSAFNWGYALKECDGWFDLVGCSTCVQTGHCGDVDDPPQDKMGRYQWQARYCWDPYGYYGARWEYRNLLICGC